MTEAEWFRLERAGKDAGLPAREGERQEVAVVCLRLLPSCLAFVERRTKSKSH